MSTANMSGLFRHRRIDFLHGEYTFDTPLISTTNEDPDSHPIDDYYGIT